MPDASDRVERHVEAGRTTSEEARARDPHAARQGIQPSPLTYTEKAGSVDLGVDEPVLPESEADAEAGSPPTGMRAGETMADRLAEEAVRRTLEDRFRGTQGDWKRSGAVPDDQ